MKKSILLLAIAILTTGLSFSQSTRPVFEAGEFISTTEANSRIDHFTNEYSQMVSYSDLSTTFYDNLSHVSKAKGFAFTYIEDMGFIAFAVDTGNVADTSLIYLLDASGGDEISMSEADSLMNLIDNEEYGIPGSFTLGLDILDSIRDQTGTTKIRVYNALDENEEEDNYLNIIVFAFKGEATFGNPGSTGIAKCRVWVPGQWHQGSPSPVYVAGHWRDCTWAETCTWLLTSSF